jgi:hypothetical protein
MKLTSDDNYNIPLTKKPHPITIGCGFFMFLFLFLVRCLKFLKEASVVLREHTEVGNVVLEVGDTLYTKTECVARIYLRVYSAKLQYVRVNHSATENLYPASMLAESTTLTATDMARDIHFG